ncbi:MAG: type II toxin-antitoxin system VapC family toxin [Deltaproteobacteria bacterium]|nr:type II toxin-antitoxin system VapC family toxin [Deltaproteobacteria bacterium]
MVIDTSALVAVLLREKEAEIFAKAIARDPKRLISAFTALETGVVIEVKKGEAGGREFDLLVHRAGIDIIPMNGEQFQIARVAWRTYGKRRHPAGLNIGDCCSYALAKYAGEALLYKGDDFSKTDIRSAEFILSGVE